MQNVMPESLRNTKNDWMDIYRHETGESLTMATYLRALEFDCFSAYVPKFIPEPQGWSEAYMDFQNMSPEGRPALWRQISQKFSGFLKKRSEVDYENKSNAYFLREMMEFFNQRNMPKQAEQCRLRLLDFNGYLVAA